MGSSGDGCVARMGAARRVRGRATVPATCPCMARGFAALPSPSLLGTSWVKHQKWSYPFFLSLSLLFSFYVCNCRQKISLQFILNTLLDTVLSKEVKKTVYIVLPWNGLSFAVNGHRVLKEWYINFYNAIYILIFIGKIVCHHGVVKSAVISSINLLFVSLSSLNPQGSSDNMHKICREEVTPCEKTIMKEMQCL